MNIRFWRCADAYGEPHVSTDWHFNYQKNRFEGTALCRVAVWDGLAAYETDRLGEIDTVPADTRPVECVVCVRKARAMIAELGACLTGER